ncbi:MAG: thiamine diphosphokinase [Anaerovoracaceae bacterium]
MNKTCIIFTSYFEGNLLNTDIIKDILMDFSQFYIIAADGGYNLCSSLSIVPNLLVGDLDSTTIAIDESLDKIIVKPQKDETDLDLALSKAIEDGYKDIIIIGGIGGRLDHTLGNIQTMVHYSNLGINISMVDEFQEVNILINSTIELKKRENYKFSLFSHTESSYGVTIKGGYYPLTNYTLSNTFPIGVSNEFASDKVQISVTNGTLIIIQTCK